VAAFYGIGLSCQRRASEILKKILGQTAPLKNKLHSKLDSPPNMPGKLTQPAALWFTKDFQNCAKSSGPSRYLTKNTTKYQTFVDDHQLPNVC